MLSSSESAAAVLAVMKSAGLVQADELSVHGNEVRHLGGGAFVVPKERSAGLWRSTVNRSLLPRSVSPESKRHVLYAVLQDLINGKLRLKKDTSSSRPLAYFGSEFGVFDDVYRVPPERGSERDILYPIHIAVPAVFDTYRRSSSSKDQTDKGFRGKFLRFFAHDETGHYDDILIRIVQNLFAQSEGLTALDKALVKSLGRMLIAERRTALSEFLSSAELEDAEADGLGWWAKVYNADDGGETYHPLPSFAAQGQRLSDDIAGIAHTAGLSRIERVAFVERLLQYHFALYLVRLTRVLYQELTDVLAYVAKGMSQSPWQACDVRVEYQSRQSPVPNAYHAEYNRLMDKLNEAYLLLPLLNNVELAIRSATAQPTDPARKITDGKWAEASIMLQRLDSTGERRFRVAVTFLALLAKRYVGCEVTSNDAQAAAERPIETLHECLRIHYSDSDERRYPKNHHQNVFEMVAGDGGTAFVQRQPHRHIVLGDELIYLLVLTLFEHRDEKEREASTCVPRRAGVLRRQRLPLRVLEERLQEDLLFPATPAAHDDLRQCLGRLGLLDRLSDAGEGNFLRHPTGI